MVLLLYKTSKGHSHDIHDSGVYPLKVTLSAVPFKRSLSPLEKSTMSVFNSTGVLRLCAGACMVTIALECSPHT